MPGLKERFDGFRWITLLVGGSILLSACGASVQPEPTATSPPPSPTTKSTDIPEPTSVPMLGTDIQVELSDGDLENGEYLAIILECQACHVSIPLGLKFETTDEFPRILERGELRIADPDYEGEATTNEEYIIESIVLPRAHIIEGTWKDDAMPADYGQRMTAQDLADIFAWLGTFE